MTDNQYEFIQNFLDTNEFITINISNRYLLFHHSLVHISSNQQLKLELQSIAIEKLFHKDNLTTNDAKIVENVDLSLYDIIIFADKSVLYTHKRPSSDHKHSNGMNKKFKPLPYYVYDDLELLRNLGISQHDIDIFVNKLNANDNMNTLNLDQYDRIIETIINHTDIRTRLNCRQVSQKWKNIVDHSSAWNSIKLTKLSRPIDQTMNYFQNIDIRKLDLSETLYNIESYDLKHDIYIYSLRSLFISTEHPLELFIFLCRVAPFLQHIKLIEKRNSSINLYDFIQHIICQCEEKLKCLHHLQIQLQSISDQIFLESSSTTKIPVSFEVIQISK